MCLETIEIRRGLLGRRVCQKDSQQLKIGYHKCIYRILRSWRLCILIDRHTINISVHAVLLQVKIESIRSRLTESDWEKPWIPKGVYRAIITARAMLQSCASLFRFYYP